MPEGIVSHLKKKQKTQTSPNKETTKNPKSNNKKPPKPKISLQC